MKRFFLQLFLLCAPALAQTGQLSITVKNESGAPVAGALVSISQRPMYRGPKSKAPTAGYQASAKTGQNGIAMLTNVPEGAYEICGDAPGAMLVNSCVWAARPAGAFAAAGATTPANVVLKKGSRVAVQANDAIGALKSEAVPGNKLRLAIQAAGSHEVPMTATQTAAGVRQFSLIIPVDADLKLKVRSETIQVADSTGAKLNMKDPQAFIPLRIPAAAAVASVSVPQVQLSLVGLLH